MKLVTCLYKDEQQLGIVKNEGILLSSLTTDWPTECMDMFSLIEGGVSLRAKLSSLYKSASIKSYVKLNAVEILAPIPTPRKNIMCLGLNYADHVKESLAAHNVKVELPEHPIVFTKSVSSVNGPFSDIPFDQNVSVQLDWEVELAVIIGKIGRNIKEKDAYKHIFGYTVINDISARDLQFRHKQYFLGKSLDGACPMGPWIVTADHVADPQNLDLHCWVNGKLKQSSNTRHQIFNIAKTIEILSLGMTLEPGDIIATGTPSGVGFARTPPEFLKPDDIVECEVVGIGKIKNKVVNVIE